MPTDNSQATPPELVTPTGVEVPETAAQEASTQPEPQTETPLTPELVRQMAREEATRIAQSQVAKGENRIQKLIQEKFTALDKTKETLGLSPEQVTQAKQKIVTEAYSSTEEETQETTPPTSPANVEQAIQYMNAQITNVFDEVGTSVTKADPEFKDLQKVVDESWNDQKGLAKILLATQRAATAKAARLQRNSQGAAARVVGGSGERTQTNPRMSSSDKISKGLKGPYNQGPPPGRQE